MSFANLVRYAEQLKLDTQSFHDALTRRTFAGRVREQYAGGVRSGVTATPAFFINGERHAGGWDLDSLLEAIEEAGVRNERRRL